MVAAVGGEGQSPHALGSEAKDNKLLGNDHHSDSDATTLVLGQEARYLSPQS